MSRGSAGGVNAPLTAGSPRHHRYEAVATTSTTATMASKTIPSSHNPFLYRSPMDTYEKIKIVFMCLLGIPLLRVVVILILGLLLVLIANIALLGYRPDRGSIRQSLPKWRKIFLTPVPFLIRAILFVLGYYWISVKTPKSGVKWKHLPRIIVSNHISFVDGPFFFAYLSPSIAMKAELADIPLIGKVILATQPILIDRKTSEGRKHAMEEIANHIASPNLPPLLIFPEGTTSDQDYLTKFKVGSFTSGLPCQPVVIRYPFNHFDVSWTVNVSALYLFLRMLCQVYNNMEVEFLPPYFPSEEEKQHPELYAEGVRQQMAAKLGVICTNHAFEDVALLLQVGEYAQQHVVPLTDMSEVMSLTALRGANAESLVKYFVKHDVDKNGRISKEELTCLFPLDDPKLITQLFELVDTDGNGEIDFRELCMGLRVLNPKYNHTEDLSKFAFRLYDLDNNGVIDAEEVKHLLEFCHSFYGADATGEEPHHLAEEVKRSSVDGQITYEVFQQLISNHPEMLTHAREKLEILRGSLRE